MTAPLAFQYLRVAWLTYPYHCCAFQFPATHHPEEFAKHEVSIRICEDAKSNSPILNGLSKIATGLLYCYENFVALNPFFVQTTV